jgi:transposase
MKAYSSDMRQKLVDIYYGKKKISQRKLAERFNVAPSFVQEILKQYRETGDISPKVREMQTPTKLNSEQLEILGELVREKNDATLEELREQLHQRVGVLIGRATVDRMVKKLGFTVKKNAPRDRERE